MGPIEAQILTRQILADREASQGAPEPKQPAPLPDSPDGLYYVFDLEHSVSPVANARTNEGGWTIHLGLAKAFTREELEASPGFLSTNGIRMVAIPRPWVIDAAWSCFSTSKLSMFAG